MGSVGIWLCKMMIRYEREKKRGETMKIAMLSFKLTLNRNAPSIQGELLRQIQEHEMAPYYCEVCNYFSKQIDEALYTELKAKNEVTIKSKQEEIELKKKNGSEDDVLDLLLSLVSQPFQECDR